MKRTTFLLLMSALSAGQAFAGPTYIDVGASGQTPGGQGSTPMLGGDLDTFTSVFTQLSFFADTTTTQYDTNGNAISDVGDRFIDTGTASITDLLPPLGDDEGLGFLSEITIAWTGLLGRLTSNLMPVASNFVQNFIYDSDNTSLSFYFQGDAAGVLGAPNGSFGSSVGASDNTGFTDGQKVLEIAIKGGEGSNTFDSLGQFISGSSLLMGEITYALDNFWWFDNGDNIPGTAGDKDFHDLLGMAIPITLKSRIDQNTEQVVTDLSGAGLAGPLGFGNELFKIHSTYDGSMDFTVPEPGTLALLGLGLVLIPTIRRSILGKRLV
ncbi:PEP-CTERM sorting domain-containing protein [Candidatus Berkiella cookevillensis]|uniref:PEP-CTERM sorting domain-containing protein n=1 Tax=Candidatus Berkiella cookevillensis TaxID=437022 RepID=A0A0Q9YGD0_9GAMM|nr:PEP-CTERM sorting domain-containing protein [Candidatus Berkiella cookevillensis]MCS5709596.1 PEP-CTERM sorting domain-containing protein [Candidatus Berkiella cookevillensis]